MAQYVYDAWGSHYVVKPNSEEFDTDLSSIGNINPIRYRGYYWDEESGCFLVFN